jgi:hypothetical protein
MTPMGFLAIVVGLTGIGVVYQVITRGREMRALAVLAGQQRLNYSATDHLRLAPRVAEHFPIPGAADLRVYDLIYGASAERYLHLFTVEYTAGVVHMRHRVRRACMFDESRDPQHRGQAPLIRLAPHDLPLLEQYQHLLAQDEANAGEANAGEAASR